MTQKQSHDITCEAFQILLEEYVAGELDSQIESTITSHLTVCDRCQHELQLALTIDTVLDDLPEPTSPPEILREVTAYVRENPVSSGWWHRNFQFSTVLELLLSPLLRVSAMVLLIGIMLFGVHQYHKYIEVEQAKSDFNYAMSKMQSAVRKTSLAVNDSFTSINVDEAPQRALEPTKHISPAIQQSLGILNILTGSENSQKSDTIKSNNDSIQLNNQNTGGNTQ